MADVQQDCQLFDCRELSSSSLNVLGRALEQGNVNSVLLGNRHRGH